ncbi:WxL protein peptidoglycan domain-containing protein [Kitasatospora purpeofusca]|uniref:WxL protein peptidoglycan domain-containing protein n=1 Tax=Kitasatospora purpeofusca TaxID=67352 RepID=UPI003F4AA576
MRRASVATLLLVVLTAFLPVQARAADNGEWSVEPADSVITPRTAFQLSASPGATFADRAVVTNSTDGPLTLRLHVADAYNTPRDGGLAVRGEEETQRDVGTWGKPEHDVVTVPAHASVTVPFTLTIPADAPPGDHVGALVAVDDRVQPGAGSFIGVRRAVGARIYLRVEGPQRPALAVEGLRLTTRNPPVPGTGDSSTTVSFTLHNTGNVKLDPRATLRVGGIRVGGPATKQLTNVPAELLPGEKVQVTEGWEGAPSGWGEVTVTATANGADATGSVGFLDLPWILLGAVLALLAGGSTALVVRRRRRGGRGRTGARPAVG